jgi:hypothetical protein
MIALLEQEVLEGQDPVATTLTTAGTAHYVHLGMIEDREEKLSRHDFSSHKQYWA